MISILRNIGCFKQYLKIDIESKVWETIHLDTIKEKLISFHKIFREGEKILEKFFIT